MYIDYSTLYSADHARVITDSINDHGNEFFTRCKEAIDYSVNTGNYIATVKLDDYPALDANVVVNLLENKGYNVSISIPENVLMIKW